jgi:PAS domain S-box-containing protein
MMKARKIKSGTAGDAIKKIPLQKAHGEKKLRILILEDSAADAALMEHELKKSGFVFAAQRVENKGEFLRVMKTTKPDLILADYRLPKFDALQALALHNQYAQVTPFIIVTGSISEEVAVECMKQGADDYLLKDRLVRLGEAVRNSLTNHRLQLEKISLDEALHKAATQWRTTFDSMNDAVCLLDNKGAVLQCNRAMNELLGLPFKKIIGTNCLGLICGKDKIKTCAFTKMMKTRQRMEEAKFWRGRWYHTTVDPVIGAAGKMIGAVHIMTDITRQKDSESQREAALKALRESEVDFRSLFENSIVGISQALPDGHLTRCNLAYARMYGYSTPEEIITEVADIGQKLYADPKDREKVLAILKAEGIMEPTEIQVRHRDGTLFTVLAGAREVRDADGQLVCYQAEHVDVTHLKQTQKALYEMNEIFRLFLKHSPIYVFIKDENIRPKYLSENYEKMLDRPLAELLGKNMDELFPSELSRSMIEDDKKILRDGKPLEFIEELNGRTYSTLKFPIIIDNKPKYLAGYTTDITERRRAQELQQDTARRLQLALHSVKAGTWDWNVATGHIDWSPQMFELFGLDPYSNSASFETWRTALHPEDREYAENRIDQALKQHMVLDSDYRVVLPGGQIRWISAAGVGIYDDSGSATQMIGICQDISGRKGAEEQIRASLLEKEILLKEIHHRVKNNLQVISGLLTLQAEQTNDERLQRMVKESQSRIWTMALIHQTLYQTGNLADIDMADYVRNLTGNLLSSHAQFAMPPTVIFDLLPVRLAIDKAIPLALIINELVTNAMKHAFPDGRPGEIRIALQKCSDKSSQATVYGLVIADNGAGMPAGFDAAKQKSLGLQLVTMLVKQLDGTLAIASGQGTAVTITFNSHEKNEKQS